MGDNSTDSEEGSDNPLPTTPRLQLEGEVQYLIDYDQVLVRITFALNFKLKNNNVINVLLSILLPIFLYFILIKFY